MVDLNVDEPISNENDRYDLLRFAKLASQRLADLNSNINTKSVSFTDTTKEDILKYLKSPKTNEKRIRNVSISMFNSSSHYRRLICYYALMPTWSYTLSPLGFNGPPKNPEAFSKAYYKAASAVETMNLKHEMQKVLITGLREGVFYGAVWSSNTAFFIQPINPDYCALSSIEDGTWMYSVDMSKIKELELDNYPPAFRTMWNTYQSTGDKWQEVPSDTSFCFKADETTALYSLPPWSASMSLLLDIENYKALQETASEISNYKLLHLEIPVDNENTPKMTFDQASKYYDLLASNLPPFVGASMAPMKLTDYNFDNSGGLRDVDIVARSERQFWTDSGNSSLLFGDAANNTAGALKLSIRADEELVFGWVNQCERLINRILKNMSGAQKFKITFLPTTIYNIGEMVDYYKNASTLGIPVKSAYASVLGVNTTDVIGMDYIERNILGMDELSPLSSSYNTSSDEGGRPTMDEEDLSESGTATRDGGDGSDG